MHDSPASAPNPFACRLPPPPIHSTVSWQVVMQKADSYEEPKDSMGVTRKVGAIVYGAVFEPVILLG